MARLHLSRGDRILDIGCGTGALLHRLAAMHSATKFSGVDPAPEMLAIARRKLPPAVELRQDWAEKLPFADRQFDVVVSCNMFHYIADPSGALREIRRILRPGGRLVITDWCGDDLASRVLAGYQRLLGRAHAQVYRACECVERVEKAGFAAVALDRYKLSWLWGLMTAQFVIAHD